jgi:hypothetical protein
MITVPYKPRVNLRALGALMKMQVQGYAIQPCTAIHPPKAYQPVEDLTPSIKPTETMWVKAKKRKCEICEYCR